MSRSTLLRCLYLVTLVALFSAVLQPIQPSAQAASKEYCDTETYTRKGVRTDLSDDVLTPLVDEPEHMASYSIKAKWCWQKKEFKDCYSYGYGSKHCTPVKKTCVTKLVVVREAKAIASGVKFNTDLSGPSRASLTCDRGQAWIDTGVFTQRVPGYQLLPVEPAEAESTVVYPGGRVGVFDMRVSYYPNGGSGCSGCSSFKFCAVAAYRTSGGGWKCSTV